MLFNIKTFINSVNQSWVNFKTQTQIIVTTLIIISLFINNITSTTLATIQDETIRYNIQFTNELNSFLNASISSFFEIM